jgi:hypothetical protein
MQRDDIKRRYVGMFRGSLKTIICDVGARCQAVARDPNTRILVVSASGKRAITFSAIARVSLFSVVRRTTGIVAEEDASSFRRWCRRGCGYCEQADSIQVRGARRAGV